MFFALAIPSLTLGALGLITGCFSSSKPVIGLLACALCHESDTEYYKEKALRAIEEAKERIFNGGGSGNQDNDHLKSIQDEYEALKQSSSGDDFFKSIIETAESLGNNPIP